MVWEEEEEEGRRGEAHFAFVSLDVLQATRAAATTRTFPTTTEAWRASTSSRDAVTTATAPVGGGDQTQGFVGRVSVVPRSSL